MSTANETVWSMNGDIPIPSGIRVLNDGEEAGENDIILRIITQPDGDKRLVWDSTDFAQIADARELFNDLIAEGMQPYIIGEKGEVTKIVMDEFDALAEQVMMIDKGSTKPRTEIIASPVKALAGG
ncbi:MAG: hypothetical protein ACW99G_02665 [Candidatus Thorarchaeota archaeon]|jgi:hypothetical protein